MSNETKQSLFELLRFAVTILIIVIPIRTFIAQPFIVSGDSMFPTFKNREYLIIDQLSYYLRSPERGEVVVFKYPEDHRKYFIKRIIGLPGETVTISGTDVSITTPDGIKITIDDTKANFTDNLPHTQTITRTLGDQEYFVMGDNRDWSSDSRSWGPVTEDLIRGRALVRLFPFTTIELLPGSLN